MTTKEQERERRKRSFKYFISKTYKDFIYADFYDIVFEALQNFHEDVRLGNSPRLMINMPPRLGKSSITAVRFALFCLLNNPDWEIVCASYVQSLSVKHSRQARELLNDDYVRLAFPDIKLSDESGAVHEWSIKYKGVTAGGYKACGVGGSLTGSGSNILIIDDSSKNSEEADSLHHQEKLWDWYTSVALTRLAPNSGVLVIQTRWNLNDLTGQILAKDSGLWQTIAFPALDNYGESIHPARFSTDFFLNLKKTLSPRLWCALYMQEPIQRDGNLIKEQHLVFKTLDYSNANSWLQSWDLRFGKSQEAASSYVVGQVWCKIDKVYYLVDQVREKLSYYETKQAFVAMSNKWPQAKLKLVEHKANGAALEDDLQSIGGIELVNPHGDKIQRLEYCYGSFVSGQVIINPELERVIKPEFLAFPKGQNDDMVDAATMAIKRLMDDETILQVFAI